MRRFAITGFVIWLLATVAVRLAGQWFFRADELLWMVALYAVTAAAMWLLTMRLFSRIPLAPGQQVAAACALSLPGMFADALSIAFFANIFPNMPASYAAAFGGWLMFAYAVVLLTGFAPAIARRSP